MHLIVETLKYLKKYLKVPLKDAETEGWSAHTSLKWIS